MAALSDKAQRELGVTRETVESIWVAIVLAFVLRAFMFEAFVIPTGSMAPRLVGKHWDVVCPSCGLEYAYGLPGRPDRPSLDEDAPELPDGAVCPQCYYPYALTKHKSYINGGDRVLVLKYIYNFMDPRPWDVVVFKNPQNNQENYIKRLVGLPGETIEIINGDIYYHADDGRWKIRRKDSRKTQEAMWQIVFDNDYRPNMDMIEQYVEQYKRDNPGNEPIRPPKWAAAGETAARHWNVDTEGEPRPRRFAFDGCDEPCELEFKADRSVFGPRYGYNIPAGGDDADAYVCSDLNLTCTFVPGDASASVNLILTSFEHRFRAEVRADGTVTLFHSHPRENGGREAPWLPSRNIGRLKPGRGHEIALWHVDHRVTLWVGDEVALQTTDAQYCPEPDELRRKMQKLRGRPDETDKRRQTAVSSGVFGDGSADTHGAEPAAERDGQGEDVLPTPKVRISAQGGPCELAHVRLMRDVYYTYQRLQAPNRAKGDGDVLMQYAAKYAEYVGQDIRPGNLGWGVTGKAIELKKHDDNPDLDEFFMLGDNSPQSLDGRAWMAAAPTLRLWRKDGQLLGGWEKGAEPIYTLGTVPRYSLIGRALFVYWPGGFRVPMLPRWPLIPNVGRMRLIR